MILAWVFTIPITILMLSERIFSLELLPENIMRYVLLILAFPVIFIFGFKTASIVIQGVVKGDKITFELYGTGDGRTASIDGPHTLSSVPAGPPIIVETDTLAPGVKKQVEHAHPGGTAIATYTITYPDSTIKTQVFNSSYKRWPERWLIGVAPKTVDIVAPSVMSPPTSPTPPVTPEESTTSN